MTTITNTRSLVVPDRREHLVVMAGASVGGLILLACAHAVVSGRALTVGEHNVWLALHLASVIPAIPLGAYVLLRRKGDRFHRLLGRLWAMMMLSAALSSFGLHGLTGGLSWIHFFSIVVLVMIPRGVIQAMRHNIDAHRRTMTLTYLGLIVAGLFTLVPGRLLGSWLFG